MIEWKTIESNWEINQHGQVRHKRSKRVLKLRLRRDGYLDVKLSHRRHLVHRLVAIAFLPNPNNLPQVNHKDGVRDNPVATNLEWCNQKQNMAHAFKNGLFPGRDGEKNANVKITKEIALIIKTLLAENISTALIAKKLGLPYSLVSNIKYGRSWANI